MNEKIEVYWTAQAKSDLKYIFEWFKENVKPVEIATKIRNSIVAKSKDIHYVEQYQVDEFLGEPFRKMIEGNYKIIYEVVNPKKIKIVIIFDTRQNPIKLKRKK
jgi:plasmid stabilization system protein ParE